MEPMSTMMLLSMALQAGGPALSKLFRGKAEVPGYIAPSAAEREHEAELKALTREGAVSGPMIGKSTRQIGGTTQQGLQFIDSSLEDPVERMNAVLNVMSDASRMGSDAVLDAEMYEDRAQGAARSQLLGMGRDERMMRMNAGMNAANIRNMDRGKWEEAFYEGGGNVSQTMMMLEFLKMLGKSN